MAVLVLLANACAPLHRPVRPDANFPSGTLPLGTSDLIQTHAVDVLAPGLRHHHIVRGKPGADQHWVVSTPVAHSLRQQAEAKACLERAGLVAIAASYRTPGSNPEAYTVFRGGAFASEKAARDAVPAALVADCRLSFQHSSGDPQATRGPWSLHIVEIDPRHFRGRLVSALGQGRVVGLGKTSDIARRDTAIAAVNAGFFVMKAEEGVVGEPAGIAVIAGRIESEATRQRPYLLIRDGRPLSAEVVDAAEPGALAVTWPDGSRSTIDGVNRRPNFIRNCGVPGSRPTAEPLHDVTCANPDELVALTPTFGRSLAGEQGRALLVRSDGSAVPASVSTRPGAGEVVLVATGKRAAELAGKTRASLDLTYRSPQLREPSVVYAVNGGPLLVRDGQAVRREDREGWLMTSRSDPARAAMVHGWVNRRNPRTAAGIAPDGRIFLVTVDGREFEGEGQEKPPASVGMTIEELRTTMRWLGVRDAINLDGGGSTTMVIRGAVVNRPSDRTGERPVGDAILVLPERR